MGKTLTDLLKEEYAILLSERDEKTRDRIKAADACEEADKQEKACNERLQAVTRILCAYGMDSDVDTLFAAHREKKANV